MLTPSSLFFLQVIPRTVLENARGFAIFSVFKAGFLFSARAGSGVVIARLDDGSECCLSMFFFSGHAVLCRCDIPQHAADAIKDDAVAGLHAVCVQSLCYFPPSVGSRVIHCRGFASCIRPPRKHNAHYAIVTVCRSISLTYLSFHSLVCAKCDRTGRRWCGRPGRRRDDRLSDCPKFPFRAWPSSLRLLLIGSWLVSSHCAGNSKQTRSSMPSPMTDRNNRGPSWQQAL